MRRMPFLVLLSVLVVSLLASNWLVSMVSASNQKTKWFYWNVYLRFPSEGGPPEPFQMDSNLIWAKLDYIVNSEDLFIPYSKVTEDGMFFFYRTVRNTLAFSVGGVQYTGAYTLEMVIVWELSAWQNPAAGVGSTTGRFQIYDGVGVFEGIKAHGSAYVEYDTHPDYGLILVQYQEGIITHYQNDVVTQNV